MPHTIIEKLIDAAEQHGEDDHPDHTVGDLVDLLRTAWSTMSVEQKRLMLKSDAVQDVVDCGAREEFDVAELEQALNDHVQKLHADLLKAGFEVFENEDGYYWQSGDGEWTGMTFKEFGVAIEDGLKFSASRANERNPELLCHRAPSH